MSWESTGRWRRVDFQAIDPIVSSTETFSLQRGQWPPWAQPLDQMERLWVYCPDAENAPAVPGSTATVVARILTERYDEKDHPKPYNYTFYLIAQGRNGGYHQSPPIRTSDPEHHSSGPAEWLDAYGPPPV